METFAEQHLVLEQQQTAIARVEWLLFRSNRQPIPIGSAIALLYWSVVLVFPGSTFQSSPRTFRVMANLAPEPLWGAIGSVLFLLYLFSALYHRDNLFGIALFLIFVWWVFIGCVFFIANPVTLGTGSCLAFATTTAWAWLRHMARRRET